MKIFIVAILIVQISLFNFAANAAYSEKEKSINLTAETLPEGSGEVGFLSLSYGVTDSFQLTVPTLPLAFGVFSAGGKYKIDVSNTFILAPSASVGYYFPDGGGFAGSAMMNATFRFDNNTEAFSLGIGAQNAGKAGYSSSDGLQIERDWSPTWYVNYDWYTSGGNLWYVGVAGLLPYAGFTWAWTNFHLGVGLATVLPYAYLYWRF
jgi:hypothetical protein